MVPGLELALPCSLAMPFLLPPPAQPAHSRPRPMCKLLGHLPGSSPRPAWPSSTLLSLGASPVNFRRICHYHRCLSPVSFSLSCGVPPSTHCPHLSRDPQISACSFSLPSAFSPSLLPPPTFLDNVAYLLLCFTHLHQVSAIVHLICS